MTDLAAYTDHTIPDEVKALFRLCDIRWTWRLGAMSWNLRMGAGMGIHVDAVVDCGDITSLPLMQLVVANMLANRDAIFRRTQTLVPRN